MARRLFWLLLGTAVYAALGVFIASAQGVMVMSPPARFNHQYAGMVIEHQHPVAEARDICASKGTRADACAWVARGVCHIVIPTRGAPVSDLASYRRHEIAHCNGWPASHPD